MSSLRMLSQENTTIVTGAGFCREHTERVLCIALTYYLSRGYIITYYHVLGVYTYEEKQLKKPVIKQ